MIEETTEMQTQHLKELLCIFLLRVSMEGQWKHVPATSVWYTMFQDKNQKYSIGRSTEFSEEKEP